MVGCGELMGFACKKSVLAAVAALFALSLFSGTAFASTDAILQDCNDDGVLNGDYSKSDLQNALGNIPSDLAQYSDCEGLISAELNKQVTKKFAKLKKQAASGNIASASKATKKKIAEQVEEDNPVSTADGELTAPAGTDIQRSDGKTLASSTAPGVPTALIVAVIGLLLLFGTDLAGRVANMPSVKKIMPKSGRGAGSSSD